MAGAPAVRPVPWLAAVPWVLAAVGLLVIVVSAVVVARRQARRRRKVLVWGLHVLLLLGGAAGTLAADPEFPFGRSHVDSLKLPGARGTAHLFRGGLLCDQAVWISPPGSLMAYRDNDSGTYSCAKPGSLTWDATQGRAQVVGDDGRRLESAHRWVTGLLWGPH